MPERKWSKEDNVHCYLYFSYWNPSEPLPEILNEAISAFESGKMVMVVFGVSSKYLDKLATLQLRFEYPIDWIIVNEEDCEATKSNIKARFRNFERNDKLTLLAWDESWLGFPIREIR